MYCKNCGKELPEGTAVCTGCGVLVNAETTNTEVAQPVVAEAKQEPSGANKTLGIIAKVFLIIGVICTAWCLIPLAWTLPITIKINNRINKNEPVGTGLKVCALLFVNTVAGILLLCRKDD